MKIKNKLIVALIFTLILAIVITLLVLSFKKVSPFEIGFSKNLVFGRLGGIDTEGNFMVGIDHSIITVQKTVMSVQHKNLIFTSSDGKKYQMDFIYVFRINPNNIMRLYTDFGGKWIDFYRSFSASEVKAQLQVFSSGELRNQAEISDRMYFKTDYVEEFIGVFFTKYGLKV